MSEYDVTKEELETMLNEAFQKGLNGYEDLKESVVMAIIEDFIEKFKKHNRKSTSGQMELDFQQECDREYQLSGNSVFSSEDIEQATISDESIWVGNRQNWSSIDSNTITVSEHMVNNQWAATHITPSITEEETDPLPSGSGPYEEQAF